MRISHSGVWEAVWWGRGPVADYVRPWLEPEFSLELRLSVEKPGPRLISHFHFERRTQGPNTSFFFISPCFSNNPPQRFQRLGRMPTREPNCCSLSQLSSLQTKSWALDPKGKRKFPYKVLLAILLSAVRWGRNEDRNTEQASVQVLHHPFQHPCSYFLPFVYLWMEQTTDPLMDGYLYFLQFSSAQVLSEGPSSRST